MSQTSGKSFWTTLPGIVTASAALLTAIAGLIAVLHGQKPPDTNQDSSTEKQLQAQVDRAFSEAGSVITATENLEATVLDSIWSPRANVPPDRAKRIAQERREIVESFDSTLVVWQKEREQIALRVTYLLGTPSNDPGDSWRRVQAAIDSYITCVKRCYLECEKHEVYGSCGCGAAKESAWVSLRSFAKTLAHTTLPNSPR